MERSEKWVEKVNQKLKNNYYEESNIKTKSRSGPKRKLTPSQITSLTFGAANKRRKSIRKSSKRFNRNNGHNVTVSKSHVHKLRKQCNLKPFHRVNAPMITNLNIEHRLRLAKHFINLFNNEPEILPNMVFMDEFYIYQQRKINSKNDIIWAFSVNDIPDHLRYNKYPRKLFHTLVFVLHYLH